MSAKVTHLHSDADLVEMLELLLQKAKTGELRTFASVFVLDGDPSIFWIVDAPKDVHIFGAGVGDLFYRCFMRRCQEAVPNAEDDDDDDTAS